MRTKGDFVSEIRNHLKSLNKDDYIGARYILSVANTYIQYLINSRPLSKTMRDLGMFTQVECIEMKRIRSYKCDIAEFKTAHSIMRSKKKIPEIFNSSGGFIIEGILNINNEEEYKSLRSPRDFKNNNKRQFGNSFKFYYINDYLYLLNTTTEIVSINALFVDPQLAKELSSCEDCDECASRLEDDFVCPQEFESTVRDQVVQLLLGGHKQIVQDENPDLDNNQKGRTV